MLTETGVRDVNYPALDGVAVPESPGFAVEAPAYEEVQAE